MWLILILLVIVGSFLVAHYSMDDAVKEATACVEANEMRVLNTEIVFFNFGPFHYCGKGQYVVRVECVDSQGKNRIYYYRTAAFFGAGELEEDL